MKIKLVVLMILAFCTFTGCYDNDEIDTFANVTAIGIEKEGFSFLVADTGSFSGEGDKGTESQSLCYFSKNNSIENAIEDVNRKISKKLSFSHMSIILSSRYCAEKGIYDTVNYLEGNPDIRPQTLIAVSDIKPSQYLEKLKPSLEVNPEKFFLNIFQKGSSYIPVLKMSDYTNSVRCNTDVIAPVISSNLEDAQSNEENTVISSAVLLRGGKMRTHFDDLSVLGLLNSTKNITLEYENEKYILNSINKPEIIAKTDRTSTSLSVRLNVNNKNNGFSDGNYLEDKIETFLNDISKKGYDVFGFSDIVKKSFRFQKSYDSYDWRSQLLRCKYAVDVKISDGE